MRSRESQPGSERADESRGDDETERPPADGLIGGEHGDARSDEEGGSSEIGTA